jgi:hypothetical protein
MKVFFNKHKFHGSHTLVLIDGNHIGSKRGGIGSNKEMTETRMIQIQTMMMTVKTMTMPNMNTLFVPSL